MKTNFKQEISFVNQGKPTCIIAISKGNQNKANSNQLAIDTYSPFTVFNSFKVDSSSTYYPAC